MDKKSSLYRQTSGFFIHCKEATQMVVMNECDRLTLKKRIALWYHLSICKVCRVFQKQSTELNNAIKKNEEENTIVLSLEKKEEMARLLNELHP